MASDGEVLDAFHNFINNKISAVFTGKVIANDKAESEGYIEVGFDDLTYDVKLKSIIDEKDNGLFVIPSVDSDVTCLSEGNSFEVFHAVKFNKIDKILYKGENVQFLLDDVNKLIVFNEAAKDSYMTDINKLVDKINNLEEQLNDLKQVFSGWTAVPQDGGGALKGVVTSWANDTITETTVDDIKDEKIKN